MKEKPLRILHFSDIHIGLPIGKMKWHKWLSKRAIGAANLARGRANYFNDAIQKISALYEFKIQNEIDIVINTGDYSALGLDGELELAKELMDKFVTTTKVFITVPGNHDIYVHNKNSLMRFQTLFRNVLQSDLPAFQVDNSYPLVRLFGDDLAIIALNSSRANIRPWKSSGFISHLQLEALHGILNDEMVKNRFIIILTHYALSLGNGKNDTKHHGLQNADALIQKCQNITAGAMLCGHIHKRYRVEPKGLQIPLYCAGSATMKGREGGWVFEFDGSYLHATSFEWNSTSLAYKFCDLSIEAAL